MLASEHDDLSVSAANLIQRYERESSKEGKVQGPPTRFGCTPTIHYGIQAAELMRGGPHSAYTITEDERFRPPMSQTRRPEWQHARASLLEQRDAVRLKKMRQHTARAAQTGAARDDERDRRKEAKYDHMFEQKMRYLCSIAAEERTRHPIMPP